MEWLVCAFLVPRPLRGGIRGLGPSQLASESLAPYCRVCCLREQGHPPGRPGLCLGSKRSQLRGQKASLKGSKKFKKERGGNRAKDTHRPRRTQPGEAHGVRSEASLERDISPAAPPCPPPKHSQIPGRVFFLHEAFPDLRTPRRLGSSPFFTATPWTVPLLSPYPYCFYSTSVCPTRLQEAKDGVCLSRVTPPPGPGKCLGSMCSLREVSETGAAKVRAIQGILMTWGLRSQQRGGCQTAPG